MLSDYLWKHATKNMCLNMFNVSLCIYVILDKFLSMDWSSLYRIDAYEHDNECKKDFFYLE